MECNYCKKTFKTKGNLKNHQNTAQYCLDIQNKTNDKWKCTYCEKNLASKQTFDSHLEKCVSKTVYHQKDAEIEKLKNELQIIKTFHQNEIKEKNDMIDKLQNQIRDLAEKAISKPTIGEYEDNRTTTNSHNKMIDNRVLNMLPLNLTQDRLVQTLEEKFTENHLMKGQKGIAEFMLENILVSEKEGDKKYLMKCTDPARKIFITLDENGKIIKDVNAENLTKIISEPVKEQSFRIFKQLQDRFFQLYQNISDELEDDDDEKRDLDLETERLEYATNKVGEISRLKNHNGEFVKGLIAPLTL